ncbi:20681_t:CDS:2, partial [Gigaspora margarita]
MLLKYYFLLVIALIFISTTIASPLPYPAVKQPNTLSYKFSLCNAHTNVWLNAAADAMNRAYFNKKFKPSW